MMRYTNPHFTHFKTNSLQNTPKSLAVGGRLPSDPHGNTKGVEGGEGQKRGWEIFGLLHYGDRRLSRSRDDVT